MRWPDVLPESDAFLPYDEYAEVCDFVGPVAPTRAQYQLGLMHLDPYGYPCTRRSRTS